ATEDSDPRTLDHEGRLLRFLRDAERRALSPRRRASDRCAAGERLRRAAAHLPLRRPSSGAWRTTQADGCARMERCGAERSQRVAMQVEILDMKPGRITAPHTHDLTMVSSGDHRSDACFEN